MRNRLRGIALRLGLSLAAAMAAEDAQATNWVVGVAAQQPQVAQREIDRLPDMLGAMIGPGDIVAAVNATDPDAVAHIEIPGTYAAMTNKAKATLLRQQLDAVRGSPEPVPPDALAADMAPPRFLGALATILEALPGHTAEVLVIGSVIPGEAVEPGFAMTGGFVPSDGYLTQRPDQSPFGTAGRATALAGAAVHFCYTNPPTDWVSERFRFRVGRLWAMFTTTQGGRFGSFAPLGPACIHRFLMRVRSSENFAVEFSGTGAVNDRARRTASRPRRKRRAR